MCRCRYGNTGSTGRTTRPKITCENNVNVDFLCSTTLRLNSLHLNFLINKYLYPVYRTGTGVLVAVYVQELSTTPTIVSFRNYRKHYGTGTGTA
jgi:hypothetical protein